MLIAIANFILGMKLKRPEKRNRRLLLIYAFFRKQNRHRKNWSFSYDIYKGGRFLHKDIAEKQDENNRNRNISRYINEKGFIEHQWEIKDLLFGRYPMSFNGCEIIASYNAINFLKNMGRPIRRLPDLRELISEYYEDGAALSGEFGTDPAAVRDYFIRNAYKVKFSEKPDEFEGIAAESEVTIITIFNDKDDVGKMVHTLCVTKENGKYTAHNAPGISGMTSAATMDELIRRCGFYGEKGSGVCISGISL